jgi:aspartate-semialdehyde dehydrogenase
MEAIKERIPVAVLGATGAVGQRFVQLLARHPWFRISALAASKRSAGRSYQESCAWLMDTPLPKEAAELVVRPAKPDLEAAIVFSALPAELARQIEPRFAAAGYMVCSNSSAFRMEPDVPLIIPEVNADHVRMLEKQKKKRGWAGCLVTSPNCTTTGVALALKPIDDAFGLRKVIAVSMQAVSGAGYPGLPYLDIQDNVIPYIAGEEEKIERESLLLLGKMWGGSRVAADFHISAHANRVPVSDGHTVCLSLELESKPSVSQVLEKLRTFRGAGIESTLPTLPAVPLVVTEEADRPQPRRDRGAGNGMQVSVGRVRACPVLDIRLVTCVHNTLRGAAGGAMLNAELLAAQGYLD